MLKFLLKIKEDDILIKDFHTHTNNSDGTKTPEELIDLAVSRGIKFLAVTDHDSIKGLKTAVSYAQGKLSFTPGVEFTTREEKFPQTDGKYCLHILGYGFDIYNDRLNFALDDRAKRVKKSYDVLIRNLEKYGMYFDYSQVKISCGIVMQMCDIAAYVEEHYKDNPKLKNAIEEIYGYAENLDFENFSLGDCIELIHNAGGKAVWAHPFNVYRNFSKQIIGEEQVEYILKAAVSLGIDGIEALYGDFTHEERLALCSIAKKNGLFVTCGSDYHGFKNKRNRFIEFDTDIYSDFEIL